MKAPPEPAGPVLCGGRYLWSVALWVALLVFSPALRTGYWTAWALWLTPLLAWPAPSRTLLPALCAPFLTG